MYDYLQGEKLQKYPFWYTEARDQFLWQTGYNDQFLPEKMLTRPLPWLQVYPDDAEKLGVKGGDLVQVYNEQGNGNFLVYITEEVRPGMVCAIMMHPKGTSNSMTSNYTDPMSINPWYKGGRVAIYKLPGTMPDIDRTTSFLPTDKFD